MTKLTCQEMLKNAEAESIQLVLRSKEVIDEYTQACVARDMKRVEALHEQALYLQGRLLDNIALSVQLVQRMGIPIGPPSA